MGKYHRHRRMKPEERSRRICEALHDRKVKGYHISRPARFMIQEDIPSAPKGRCNEHTVVLSEEELYAKAREGYSFYALAKEMGVNYNAVIYELKPRSQNPRRYKGCKDRYTKYLELYKEATE